MPSLIYNSAQTLCAGALTGRVLIGRRLAPGLSLADPSVSRLHAWIDPVASRDGRWTVTDAGSKIGTFVNDQQVYTHELVDGDVIRLGEVRITYHSDDILPLNATPVKFTTPANDAANNASTDAASTGILFNCGCGAPIWVVNDLAGKRGICRHCRKPVTVPASNLATKITTPSPVKTAETAPSKKAFRCGVCHSEINSDDGMVTCPDCAMHFHTECWQENLGCSSYGCPQVNALQSPATDSDIGNAFAPQDANASIEPSSSTPWELVAVAASVVAAVLGCVAFGIPAAMVAIWSVVLMFRGHRRPLLILAVLLCLAGIAGGLVTSDVWYFNGQHLHRSH